MTKIRNHQKSTKPENAKTRKSENQEMKNMKNDKKRYPP